MEEIKSTVIGALEILSENFTHWLKTLDLIVTFVVMEGLFAWHSIICKILDA